MDILSQTIGWVGTSLIVIAYFLVSTKKVQGNSSTYQVLNLLGAIGVGFNVFVQHAWPTLALESIWAVIAIVSLLK